MNLNSLGHCICVHQGKISAAAGLDPGTPDFESTKLPMSYPGATLDTVVSDPRISKKNKGNGR